MSFGYLHRDSKRCFLHPILILLWTFLCVLTFISEDMARSAVHVEPNRMSVPAGKSAARFLSGPEMKKQRETIWGRQRLRSFSEPKLALYRMFVWCRLAEQRVLLRCVFWNWPLILFHRRSAKRRMSQRETCTRRRTCWRRCHFSRETIRETILRH